MKALEKHKEFMMDNIPIRDYLSTTQERAQQ